MGSTSISSSLLKLTTGATNNNNEEEGLNNKSNRRERRKRILNQREHERRKRAWLAKYGSCDALQKTFGDERRSGLTPQQTRALYHALLPRSLLALSDMGVLDPTDLAPLAYQARIAAKEYARSRCNVKGKILTFVFDQYRSFKSGKGFLFNGANPSMTWDDLYDKYETQIMEQERERANAIDDDDDDDDDDEEQDNDGNTVTELDDDEITMKVFLRIIEKSCSTNEAFDGLFLNQDKADEEGDEDLAAISTQLEKDIQSILLSRRDAVKVKKQLKKNKKKQAKDKKKLKKEKFKAEKKREKLKRKLLKRMFEKKRIRNLGTLIAISMTRL